MAGKSAVTATHDRSAALAERAYRLIVEWLPQYTPERNDIEIV